MILLPEVVGEADVAAALAALRAKRGDRAEFAGLRLERITEGRVAQVMHIGPYATEPVLQQGSPLSIRVMFDSVPDVTALVLLAVAFFLLKAVVDACLGLLATRTTATRAPKPQLLAEPGSSAQVAVGAPVAEDRPGRLRWRTARER